MTEPNDHPMDKYIGGEGGWNDFTPEEQEMIGSALREGAELRPGWLTKEELDGIARFVRFAQMFRRSGIPPNSAATTSKNIWRLPGAEVVRIYKVTEDLVRARRV